MSLERSTARKQNTMTRLLNTRVFRGQLVRNAVILKASRDSLLYRGSSGLSAFLSLGQRELKPEARRRLNESRCSGQTKTANTTKFNLIGYLSLLAQHRLRIWDEQKALKPVSEPPTASSNPSTPVQPSSTQPTTFDIHDDQTLMQFWHSSSHLLGHAMEEKYGDDCLLCDGPALKPHSGGVSNGGFFYDSVLFKDGEKFVAKALEEVDKLDFKDFGAVSKLAESRINELLSGSTQHPIYSVGEADLADLSTRMNRLSQSKAPFERLELDRTTAARMFWYNPFKLSFLSSISPDVPVTVFRSGDFIDLCRGPHISSVGQIRAVKLTATSGAQWSPEYPTGLSRVYGISFPSPKLLKEWTTLIEEAAKRDHRVVGRHQGLFSTSTFSPGSPFILPHGSRIVQKLLDMLRNEYRNFGYEEVITPLIFNKELWETSGHWENYRDDMFLVSTNESLAQLSSLAQNKSDSSCCGGHHESAPEEEMRGLKPMNCPGHCLVFKSEKRSYRDLPLRLAEFSPLHRNEATGALTGLTRVRKFHQDDAHIFCTPDQIFAEISQNLKLVDKVYGAFGFTSYELALSTRPEKFMGLPEEWERAESDLRKALDATGKPWTLNQGDGAFYGPKIDIRVRDALGRRHQTATIQLDFQLPQRFGLKYVNETNTELTPVIVHRAILGSVERMLAILIEHTGGRWPFWLSPRQAMVIPVAQQCREYARSVRDALANGPVGSGDRYYVDYDSSDNTLSKMIREAQLAQYNFMLVIGPKELEAQTVTVRTREGGNLGAMKLEEVVKLFKERTDKFE